MKKIILISTIILLLGCSHKEIDKTIQTVNLEINDNLTFEYDSDIYLYDLINYQELDLLTDNIKLDTLSLGEHNINIEYKSNNRSYNNDIIYNVVDTTKPIVLLNSTLTVNIGTKDIVNKVLCADNYDKRPNCYIEGNYNVNKVGNYKLKYIAIDSSNNTFSKEFTLKVVKPSNNSSSNKSRFKIEDLIKNYKNDNTMIGIDVSTWQGDIDFNKVKNAGVEFVMIRLGYGHNSKGELVLDNKFKNNITNAKKENLKVGLYFYSYAKNKEEVIDQVKFIVKNLNGYALDLPVAFDFEDWKNFNSYNMSIHDLKEHANTFISELNKYGYEGILYSSKYYLEQIWEVNTFDTWLAHYTDKTSYKGNYKMWQLSSRGKVSGINGNVDLDILYK